MEEYEHEMRIMAPSVAIAKEFDPDAESYGDVKIHWDADNPTQVKRAREAFDKAIAKGLRAIKLDRKDKEIGTYLTAFDPTAERIAFIPQIQGGGPRLDALLQKRKAAAPIVPLAPPPNQQGKVGEWGWHIHHAVLYEKLTEPMQKRMDYVKGNKGMIETPTRLKLMRVVIDQKKLDSLVKQLEDDKKVYESAIERAANKGRKGKDNPDYKLASEEATAAYDDLIEAEQGIMELHRQECEPDCPWNGADIFATPAV
jgi:hypothetical protein